MAVIKPFRAYRPRKGLESQIAALPYDVYNREEACAVVAQNPYSFLAIDRAETQFDAETDTYAPEVYEKARRMLEEQIAEGRFIQEEKPCYYLYEQTMNGQSQTGIVACASIDDYSGNVIKKHENTREEKEQDRIRHVDICNMQTGPIFLAYRASDTLRKVTAKVKQQAPVYDFVSEDGVGHRVWVIESEEQISVIGRTFEEITDIYIADGHHRCASAVKVGLKRRAEHPDFSGEEEFNFFLSVLFPDEELRILDYNRVVRDLNGLTEADFLRKIGEKFEIAKACDAADPAMEGQPDADREKCRGYAPREKGEFGMFLGGNWYRLRAKPEIRSSDAVEGLDVSILQSNLLTPILGIGDPRTDTRIDFVGGIRGLGELERRCTAQHPGESPEMAVAFALYPTSIAELFAVADAGLLMPPKSTWFEPKLRSGLFLHELNEK